MVLTQFLWSFQVQPVPQNDYKSVSQQRKRKILRANQCQNFSSVNLMENLSAELRVDNQSSILATISVPLMSGEVILLYLSEKSLPSKSPENSSKRGECYHYYQLFKNGGTRSQINKTIHGLSCLKMGHNEKYYLQSVGGRVDGEDDKGAAKAHCANQQQVTFQDSSCGRNIC